MPNKKLAPVVLTLLVACASLFLSSAALAVHEVENIEMDGNTTPDGVADDWDDVFAGTASADRQNYVDDGTGLDFTVFKGGLKDIHPISAWGCKEMSPLGKGNIMSAYAAVYETAGDLILYAAADRETVEGTANFGIWLFQEAVGCDSEPNAGAVTPFFGFHVDGDLLLVAEFEQGGAVAIVNVYRWSDPDGIPENGDECLGGGLGDCSDEGEIFLAGQNCSIAPLGDFVCGITNDTAEIDTAWRTGVGVNGFYEAAANLTLMISDDLGCFASSLIETRSSTSLTASLKDFALLDVSTCGSVTVEKVANGGTGTFDFTAVPEFEAGVGPFSVPGNASVLFDTVEGDDYIITETALPSDLWTLESISCTSGQGATDLTAGTVVVTVGLADDVVCTFTNTFEPPPGAITIAKVCDSTTADAATFDYTLVGFDNSSTLDCKDGSVTLVCDTSITCLELTEGDYTVDETSSPTGWNLTDVTCDGGTTSTCGPAESPDASITLSAAPPEDASASATFTNTENATIEICKDAGGVGGDFDFTGDLGALNLADGACSAVVVVPPGIVYDVTETVPAGFTLNLINCSGTNWSPSLITATVAVTPAAGEAVSCTFTNLQNPGSIQICKQSETQSADNPVFQVNLTNDLDADLPASSDLRDGECDFGPSDENPINLTVGSGYAVSEVAVAGWDNTGLSCEGSGDAEDPNNIILSADEQVVCTFTNTQRASLTLVKTVTNDHGGGADATDWMLDAAGSTPLSGESGSAAVTNVLVLHGDYTLSESGGPLNYSAGSWGCTAGSIDGGAVVTLAPGEVATCSINNNDDPAGLTLNKIVENNNGGTAANTEWTLSATGPVVISGKDGDASITGATVSAGVYMLAESGGPAGYTAGTWSCDGGDLSEDQLQLTLGLGESASCSITNDDIAPQLTVIKHVVNNDDGTAVAGDWTMDVTAGNPSSNNFAGTEAPGNTITVDAGAYSVDESGGPDGYAKTLGSGCSGNLGVGGSASCTITNNDIPPPPTDVPIPTSGNWAKVLLILMLLATGWYFRPAVMRRF